MKNPLLCESPLPYGAPQFNEIRNEHYLPAFEEGLRQGKAEIDAIAANPEPPTFANTVEALETSGKTLDRTAGIFFNLLEADTSKEMQEIAEKVDPMMTEYALYASLNEPLFKRVRDLWERRESLGLEPDQMRLLEKTFKGFVRGGANLGDEEKKIFGKRAEELSLLGLRFGNNVLAATNSFELNLLDENDLIGLPEFVREMGAEEARERGERGWTFTLSRPSYAPFMMYSGRSDLRKKMYLAYNSKCCGGEYDNFGNCLNEANLRLNQARLLGYPSHAAYVLEERMAKNAANVNKLLDELMAPSLPAARKEVADLLEYARRNGYEEKEMQPWDFTYWSEKLRQERHGLSDEVLKPYFQLENVIEAVFGLATRLYGLRFEERKDIPGYHPDVKVFDVKEEDGSHLALLYADFFPRPSKRGGAWMTEFRGLDYVDGKEHRPLVSIVMNFSKPTSASPSLLTHDELTTFLHEFGHSLHGMMAKGRYPSMTGTSVATDFVELPSQIMENWAYEPEYLKTFARHYKSGETLPDEMIERLEASRNFQAAYLQVRQLQFGLLDMAWHGAEKEMAEDAKAIEEQALGSCRTLPAVEGTSISASFNHIFSGGYSAGYYSYKWSEVLEADAFSLFKEKGIFSREVAKSFRDNILSKGSTEDEAVLYRNFRGHDPAPSALLDKLGIGK